MSARSLYVIGGETGPLKIGISGDVAQRVATLQYDVSPTLRAHHQVRPTGDARLVERVAHQLLAAKRLRGEWFDVSIEEAIAAVEQAIALVDAGDLSLAPDPDPNIRATTIKLPVAVLTALKSMAVERRVPTNDLMVEAIEDFLRLHGRMAA